MTYFAASSYAQPAWSNEPETFEPENILSNDNYTDMNALRNTRVLLIEDDRTTRRMVSKAIGDYCDLTEAFDAGKGVNKFIHFDPDIVFLDLELPDNNGHNILEWIMWNDPGAYVVLFSGKCDEYNVQKAMNNGAMGFVPKPFSPERMMSYILQCPKLHAA